MSKNKKLLIVTPLLWLGFILSISFMEAWLKFQAPGVTLSIGLSIGKLIFGVMNKIELLFLIVILIYVFKDYKFKQEKILKRLSIGLTIIMLIQTFYLLPVLDQRADMIMNGDHLPTSYFHFYYIFLELLKVVGLIILSHITLKQIHTYA